MKMEYKQQTYRWSASAWLDHYGLSVSRSLAMELNRRFLESWWVNQKEGDEPGWVRPVSTDQGSAVTLRLVEMLARQYLARNSYDASVLAVLCAALRGQGQQLLALSMGLGVVPEGPSTLRTTLAASLRDLGRWDEACTLLGSGTEKLAGAPGY